MNLHTKKLPADRTNSQQNIMFVGTGSGVGKTLITTAFCRYLSNKGYSVAPFKSQNMSSNSFTLSKGADLKSMLDISSEIYTKINLIHELATNTKYQPERRIEISKSQYIQAKAARAIPDARMNPVLLKPTGASRSKLILMGQEVDELSAKEYYKMKDECFKVAKNAFDSLANSYSTIVLEGAGSPAEINLQDDDIVNMSMAHYANANTFLVADISAGGVFAAIKGTIDLIEERYRHLIKGIIINKFRGDKDILLPGLRQIEELMNIPVLGVLPYHIHSIEDEDSHSSAVNFHTTESQTTANANRCTYASSANINVVVLNYPRALLEPVVNTLQKYRGINIRPLNISSDCVQSGAIRWGLLGADLVIIPDCGVHNQGYSLLSSKLVLDELKGINLPIIAIDRGAKLLDDLKVRYDIHIDDSNDLSNPDKVQNIFNELKISYTVQDNPNTTLDREYNQLAELISENLDMSKIFE